MNPNVSVTLTLNPIRVTVRDPDVSVTLTLHPLRMREPSQEYYGLGLCAAGQQSCAEESIESSHSTLAVECGTIAVEVDLALRDAQADFQQVGVHVGLWEEWGWD